MTKRFGLALLALLTASPLSAAEFFVSTSGDDGQPGTLEKPFATVARARDEVRRVKGEPVTVRLRGGT